MTEDDILPVMLTREQSSLVVAHRYLAVQIAVGYWNRSGGAMDREDTISIAYQGLVNAALKFDPDWRPEDPPRFGVYDAEKAFGAFAKKKINGAILDWLRVEDHVTRRERKSYKELQERGLGTHSPEVLADLTGLPVEKIRLIRAAVEAEALSLDDDQSADDHRHSSSVEDSVVFNAVGNAVANTIADFSPLQRSVIVLSFYNGESIKVIAAELGISVLNARMLYQDGLATIHDVMVRAAS